MIIIIFCHQLFWHQSSTDIITQLSPSSLSENSLHITMGNEPIRQYRPIAGNNSPAAHIRKWLASLRSGSSTGNHFQHRTTVKTGRNVTYKNNSNIRNVYLLQRRSRYRIFAFISACTGNVIQHLLRFLSKPSFMIKVFEIYDLIKVYVIEGTFIADQLVLPHRVVTGIRTHVRHNVYNYLWKSDFRICHAHAHVLCIDSVVIDFALRNAKTQSILSTVNNSDMVCGWVVETNHNSGYECNPHTRHKVDSHLGNMSSKCTMPPPPLLCILPCSVHWRPIAC